MRQGTTDHFFENLSVAADFGQFADRSIYAPAPSDWLIALTDVKGSTQAIEAGRYKDVNAVGVASIVGILNSIGRMDVPYIFGGDGATVLVPGFHEDAVRKSLSGMKALAREGFSLTLRSGLVPVQDVISAGHEILVSRYAASKHIAPALLAGKGLQIAERWIKDEAFGEKYEVADDGLLTDVDCSGFECRWEPVQSSNGVIVSLIVQTNEEDSVKQNTVYQSLIKEISTIIGDIQQASPARRESLRLGSRLKGYVQEMRIRSNMGTALRQALYGGICWAETTVGRLLLARGWSLGGFGEQYVQDVITNTDFRKFDDALRMVLDLQSNQLEALLSMLERRKNADEIFYGSHTASSALMTCAVFSREGQHIHFVDGADGGYALAARQLKTQKAAAFASS